MKFKAYTCKGYNEEKFFIEDENERDLIVESETEADAETAFCNWIRKTSLYSEAETNLWLAENPLYIVKIA